MRSFKTMAGLSAGVLLALSGSVQAASTTTTFNVTATVATNCTVTATNLAFGAFTGAADVDSSSQINVNCTNGAPYTLALNPGSGSASYAARVLTRVSGLGTTPGTLGYQLYRDSTRNEIWGDGSASTFMVGGTGTGMANTLPHTVYGRLPTLGNSNPVEGNYESTITVTITY